MTRLGLGPIGVTLEPLRDVVRATDPDVVPHAEWSALADALIG